MVKLKRVDVLSAAKMLGVLYAVIGLLMGAIFSLMSLVGWTAGKFGDDVSGGVGGVFVGLGAVVCFPIGYAVLGFLLGALGALAYNLAAGVIGGIEIELSE